jgi:hypothetical protein
MKYDRVAIPHGFSLWAREPVVISLQAIGSSSRGSSNATPYNRRNLLGKVGAKSQNQSAEPCFAARDQ